MTNIFGKTFLTGAKKYKGIVSFKFYSCTCNIGLRPKIQQIQMKKNTLKWTYINLILTIQLIHFN